MPLYGASYGAKKAAPKGASLGTKKGIGPSQFLPNMRRGSVGTPQTMSRAQPQFRGAAQTTMQQKPQIQRTIQQGMRDNQGMQQLPRNMQAIMNKAPQSFQQRAQPMLQQAMQMRNQAMPQQIAQAASPVAQKMQQMLKPQQQQPLRALGGMQNLYGPQSQMTSREQAIQAAQPVAQRMQQMMRPQQQQQLLPKDMPGFKGMAGLPRNMYGSPSGQPIAPQQMMQQEMNPDWTPKGPATPVPQTPQMLEQQNFQQQEAQVPWRAPRRPNFGGFNNQYQPIAPQQPQYMPPAQQMQPMPQPEPQQQAPPDYGQPFMGGGDEMQRRFGGFGGGRFGGMF